MIRVRHRQQPGSHGNLVFGRRDGQAIVLRCPDTGVKIVITVSELRKNNVRIAINAPKSFIVNRVEVDREIHPDDYEQHNRESQRSTVGTSPVLSERV